MKTKIFFLNFLFFSQLFFTQINSNQFQSAIPPTNPVEPNTLLLPFSNLDKTKIETGILLDAGIEFADLKKYNGTPTDSSYTNSKTISDIYSTLIMSKISSNGTVLQSPTDFQNGWYQSQTIDLIPVAGLYFKYNAFSESNQVAFQNMAANLPAARSSNISTSSLTITPENNIVDVFLNGVWQNPYEINKLFAMAPIANSQNKLHFNVVFPTSLFLSNYSSEVSKLEVKFSDSENYQQVTLGQNITVNYAVAGDYNWTYKLTLNSGQILYNSR